jgi:hypothetical protein
MNRSKKKILTALIALVAAVIVGCPGPGPETGQGGSSGAAGAGGAGGQGGAACIPWLAACSASAACEGDLVPQVCPSPIDLRPECALSPFVCDGSDRLFCCPRRA